MRILLKLFIAVIPFLLFIPVGCNSDEEKVEESKVPVRVYEVHSDSLFDYLKIPGTITAEEDEVVYSKVSERIDKLNVRAGDKVNAGQIIAVQYNTILNQGVEAAKAAVNSAESQLNLLDQDLERMERLYKQKAVSQQQYDQIVSQRKTAQANLEAIQAQLKQAEEQYQNSIIKAPFSGLIAAVYVEANEMVPAGQPVARVINPTNMKAKAKISGKNIDLIKKGQDVLITVPSIQGKEYHGTVSVINRAVDPVSKNLEIEIKINDADESIKSGMHGEFLIASREVKDVLVIPENALLTQTEIAINKNTGIQETIKKYFLFVVNDNAAHLKEVKVGLISGGRAEVKEGLNSGDKVIVVGNNVVQEGEKVTIIE